MRPYPLEYVRVRLVPQQQLHLLDVALFRREHQRRPRVLCKQSHHRRGEVAYQQTNLEAADSSTFLAAFRPALPTVTRASSISMRARSLAREDSVVGKLGARACAQSLMTHVLPS